MLRFISFLLGKPYESCKSCETLKEQLKIMQEQNKDLLYTLIDRSKPEVRPLNIEKMEPIKPKHIPWSVTQKSLERKDREQFNEQLKRNNPGIADEVDKLEKELGVSDASKIS
jgi:hypothetical protein